MLAEKSFTSEEDFQKLRSESNTAVELIDDIVYMSPAPTPNHQRVIGRLFSCFITFLKDSKCEALHGINLRLYDEKKNKIGDVIPALSIFCELKSDGNDAFIEDIPVIAA